MKAGVRARYYSKFKARKAHADAGLYKLKGKTQQQIKAILLGDEEE